MRRVLFLIFVPVAFVYGFAMPLRAWWRVRRRGMPLGELAEAMATELRAMAKEAYDKMSPEERARIDAEDPGHPTRPNSD